MRLAKLLTAIGNVKVRSNIFMHISEKLPNNKLKTFNLKGKLLYSICILDSNIQNEKKNLNLLN